MKPIGKITRDDFCTHSLVPYLFDAGHFKTKQEVLNDCIRARHGEYKNSTNAKTKNGRCIRKTFNTRMYEKDLV